MFLDKIKTFYQKQSNTLFEYQLSENKLTVLNNYLYATLLFADCLALATVSDREAIKNSLFLPPVNINN